MWSYGWRPGRAAPFGWATPRWPMVQAEAVENVVALYSTPDAGDDVDAEDAKWEGAADWRWRPS